MSQNCGNSECYFGSNLSFSAGRAVCLTLVLLLILAAGSGHAAEYSYEKHELDIGTDAHPTVVTGDFLGWPNEQLGIVTLDAGQHCTFRLYTLGTDGWEQSSSMALPLDTEWIDVLAGEVRDELLYFTDGQLHAVDFVCLLYTSPSPRDS